MADRDSVQALTRMIAEVETLISTTTPLPENRTPRCLELLRAAKALTGDLRSRRGSSQPDMDAAADEAERIFERHWREWDIPQLAQFWQEWCGPAGYKRLGKMLISAAAPRR